MRKIRGELIVGIGVLGVVAVGGAWAGVAMIQAANAEPATVVGTFEPVDFASIPYTNGLADEQETAAAAAAVAEAERVAAEAAAAESVRVAAEQAAADEAARVAAEQAAADEPVNEEPEPSGGIPAVWVDLGNGAGMWDFSHCPTGSGSTGADGNVYCN